MAIQDCLQQTCLIFSSPDSEISVIDCPGGDDNRGLEQQVKNAFYIQTLFNGYRNTLGISNYFFAIVIKENGLWDRGLELKKTLRTFIRLVENLTPDILRNTVLIVTKGDIANVTDISVHLRDARDSLPYNSENESDKLWKLLQHFIDNANERIFFFNKPNSRTGQFRPNTKVKILEWIDSTNEFLTSLRANIVISAEVNIAISDLKHELRTRIMDQEANVLQEMINIFLDRINRATANVQGLTDAECQVLINSCSHTKMLMSEFIRYIGACNGDLMDCHFEILQRITSLPDELNFGAVTISGDIFENIECDLSQLKCAFNIESSYIGELISYDRIIRIFLEQQENIKTKQIELLARKFVLFNETFENNLIALLTNIRTTIERANYDLQQTVNIFRLFRSVAHIFTADNNNRLSVHRRVEAFKAMISDNFISPIKEFHLLEDVNADSITDQLDELIETHQSYGELLNNRISYDRYLDIFLQHYTQFINEVETNVREKIAEEIDVILTETTRVSNIIQAKYDNFSQTESAEDILNILEEVCRMHTFLRDRKKNISLIKILKKYLLRD